MSKLLTLSLVMKAKSENINGITRQLHHFNFNTQLIMLSLKKRLNYALNASSIKKYVL